MKHLLLFSLLTICLAGCGQPKKQTPKKEYWPKPLRDSTWIDPVCDTTFGTIEIPAGIGVIRGQGMVVSCEYFHMHTNIYSEKDRRYIDSVQTNDTIRFGRGWFAGSTEGFAETYPRSTAYIKTGTGQWKEITDKFVLTPR